MTHAPLAPQVSAAGPSLAGGADDAGANDLAPSLRTDRLLLRPWVPGDAEALFAIFSVPRVVRYLSRPAWTGIGCAHERERWFVAGEMSDSALYGLLARDPRAPARQR